MEIIMTKSLKTCFILSLIFYSIVIAWNTFTSFFSGVGINFVALIGIVIASILISCKNKDTQNRIKDIVFISCLFCLLESVIFFAFEFADAETIKGFIIYQNIISILGLIFLAYSTFRFWSELTNKKFKFIEILLGNKCKKPKEKKKAKELTNGCLEEKPNKQATTQQTSTSQNNEEELEIIITEDEE